MQNDKKIERDALIAEMLAECVSDAQREHFLALVAEATAKGRSWPLRPTYMAPPPLICEERDTEKRSTHPHRTRQ